MIDVNVIVVVIVVDRSCLDCRCEGCENRNLRIECLRVVVVVVVVVVVPFVLIVVVVVLWSLS